MNTESFFNKLNQKERTLYIHGVLFGYPKCCIQNFIQKCRGEIKVDYFNPYHGTGFIPSKLALQNQNL